MKHIFISHAGEDTAVAMRFHGDLRNAGHQARIDTCELRLGTNSIRFMNEGITDAHTVLILYSKHTPEAAWQNVEIDGAFWHEIQQGGGRCMVIRLDDTRLPPLLGPKVFATLEPDHSNYAKVLEQLCGAVLPSETASSVVAAAFRHGTRNPFRRVRAEFFEDLPKLLADAFAPPDAMKMNALEDMKPCFLEGPRGTGKSMLLLALRGRNLASRKGADELRKLFGFYLKLTRGAVCNAGVLADTESEEPAIPSHHMSQLTEAFSQEVILCLLESLLSEISMCASTGHLTCNATAERALVDGTHRLVYGTSSNSPSSVPRLLEYMAGTHRDLAEFIRRRFIYDEDARIPVASLDLGLFKEVLKLHHRAVAELSETLFVVLFDEYENLFPFQQRVINGLVKLAAPEFTVKIAKKLGSAEVSGTTTGQELQEIHDYNRVNLVYDVEDRQNLTAYSSLLTDVTARLLSSETTALGDMDSLLPADTSPEVPEDEWLKEVAALYRMAPERFRDLPDAHQDAKKQYYGEAAVYRVLYGRRGRRKQKRFAGFQNLAFLSSGVIRYFLEFLGVAYYMQYKDGDVVPHPMCFSTDVQSQAVHTVSGHYLTTLSRNVENDGERLKYYVLDLGDCLRFKLLKHGSEPEAGRLTVTDPELLEGDRYAELKRVLALAMREGVFQGREGRPAFKPKHRSDPQPLEINICRIFAPVLQISPRLRWRTNVTCQDLLGLWDPETRALVKRALLRKLIASASQPELDLRGTES